MVCQQAHVKSLEVHIELLVYLAYKRAVDLVSTFHHRLRRLLRNVLYEARLAFLPWRPSAVP